MDTTTSWCRPDATIPTVAEVIFRPTAASTPDGNDFASGGDGGVGGGGGGDVRAEGESPVPAVAAAAVVEAAAALRWWSCRNADQRSSHEYDEDISMCCVSWLYCRQWWWERKTEK